jgi:hypothetical protein
MPNVVKVQTGYKVQPLSAYLSQPAPPAAPAINFPKIDDEMAKTGRHRSGCRRPWRN